MMRSIAFAMVASLLASAAAESQEITVGVRDVTVVQDDRGSARVFFRTETVALPPDVLIERAELTIPYTGSAAARSLELRVCPVLASWSGGADWETPYDEEIYARAELDLQRGSGLLRFDVTGALAAMQQRGLEADGFVLVAAGDRDLAAADASRLADLSGASLRVRTMFLPSGRPPEGWLRRHGAR